MLTQPYNQSFGTTIRERRRQLNITHQQLADACSISTAYISLLEQGKRQPSAAMAAKLADSLGFDIADTIRLGRPDVRALISPVHDASAWKSFRDGQLPKRYSVTAPEMGLCAKVAAAGEVRSARDFIFIILVVRCALTLAIAILLSLGAAHAQSVATIPVSALPIHYHELPVRPDSTSGWFALPLSTTRLPGNTGYVVRLELDAWVNVSTQTTGTAAAAASEVGAQSSSLMAMLLVNGIQQWQTAHTMMEVARNQDYAGMPGHVGVEQLVRESTSWTWIVPAALVGNHGVLFGVECDFLSSLGAAFGTTNSDGSGAIEGAQLFVTPVIQPMSPVAAYACQAGRSDCFNRR